MLFLMATVLMMQLQSFHKLFLVVSVAPLGLIGVVAALLITGQPLGFVAILGVLALIGIIIRRSRWEKPYKIGIGGNNVRSYPPYYPPSWACLRA